LNKRVRGLELRGVFPPLLPLLLLLLLLLPLHLL
jgi:hypothetical protein